MQFLLLAHDGTDEEALNRRIAVRDNHIANGDRLRKEGHLLYAVAILDNEEKMIGTVAVYDYNTREELEAALEMEPYMTGDVWQDISVVPCRVGPTFRE